MRLEATVPDNRAQAMEQLAKELGLSNSRLVDEALALFLKVVMEVRRGRRLVTMDANGSQPAVELSTPTLSALEWAQQPQALTMPAAALAKVQELIDQAEAGTATPSHRLRAAAKRNPR